MSLIKKIIDVANTPISQLVKRKKENLSLTNTSVSTQEIAKELFPKSPEKQAFFSSWYQESIEKHIQETSKEINKKPYNQTVANRYLNLSVTENTDQGEYGYSTRQDIDFTEAEQCFNDPKVSQALDRLIDDVFSDDFINESKDDEEDSQLALSYANQISEEIEGELEDFLEDALKTSLFFGHYVGEIVPKWSEDDNFKGKRVINYVQSIRLGLIEFVTDNYDRTISVHSLVNFNEYYPLDRFFILRLGSLWNDAYGGSLFRKVRPYWKAKLMVRDDMIITSNRYSQPIPEVKYTESDLQAKAQEIANNLYAGVVLALPEGVTAGFIDAGLKGDNPHMVIIEYLDSMIDAAISGYGLSKETGSRASDEVKSKEKLKRVRRLRRKISGAYKEQILRRFIFHNYSLDEIPLNKYPKPVFYEQDEIDEKSFAETAEISINIGALDFDKRPNDLVFYRKKLGYPDLSQEELNELFNDSNDSDDLTEPENTDIENDPEDDVKLFSYDFE